MFCVLPPDLIVDFNDVTFLATAGMGVLIQGSHRSLDIGTAFRVVAAGHVTARPMQLLGVEDS